MQKTRQYFNTGLYIILAVIFIGGLWSLGYTLLSRIQIHAIWFSFALLFTIYYVLLKKFNTSQYYNFNFILSLTSRIILLFSIPLLSDDFYRFIWDGQLIAKGINPFSHTPQHLMHLNLNWLDTSLYNKMNSPAYYSVYPPVNQFVFWLAALPGKEHLLSSLIILRTIIIFFDIGNIFLIKKLLELKNLNKNLIFLYALNPLVIVEFSGNLHFEVAMIFFTLLGIYLIIKNKWVKASIALALAICSKLIPLIFIPLLIKEIGIKKTFYVSLIICVCTIILFLPFIYNFELLNHFTESLRLYYGKFEFNGSIYQILREIGWRYLNYNPIAYTSKILIMLTIGGFIITYIKSKNIFNGIFWLMFIYTLFGAIVHPWYILILVAFSPFLNWRFALVWSFLICLSYYTYSSIPYQENIYLVVLEYILLFGFIFFEYLNYRRKPVAF